MKEFGIELILAGILLFTIGFIFDKITKSRFDEIGTIAGSSGIVSFCVGVVLLVVRALEALWAMM